MIIGLNTQFKGNYLVDVHLGCQHMVVNTPTVNERGFRIFSSFRQKYPYKNIFIVNILTKGMDKKQIII